MEELSESKQCKWRERMSVTSRCLTQFASPTKPHHPDNLKPRIFKARKQIVVSGGTLSSPLILQRSGIGM